MTEQLTYLLIGLYFFVVATPSMTERGVARTTIIQFILSLILLILAFLNVHIIH